MAKKEFTHHGKKLEDFQAMSFKELAEHFGATARRKLTRGFTPAQKILLDKIRIGESNIKTHCRAMLILPEMVGMTIGVYTGKTFDSVIILPEMMGHSLGEFASSRKRVGHSSAGVGATKSSKTVGR